MKQKATLIVSSVVLALNLSNSPALAVNTQSAAWAQPSALATSGETDANQAAYEKLSAQLSELEASLQMAQREAEALDMTSRYQNAITAIAQQISDMKTALVSRYEAGTLTEDSTLENYADVANQLTTLLADLHATVMGQIQSIMAAIFSTLNNTIGSAIGTLEKELADMNMTETYADRVAKLKADQSSTMAYVSSQQAVIAAEPDYVVKLEKAKDLRPYVDMVTANILSECERILAEAKEAYAGQTDANQAAYEKLSAQLSELESSLVVAQDEISAIAQVNGQAWAGQFAYQVAMLSQQISIMKGNLASQYAAGTLTEESILDNYENISGQVAQLRANLEQTINGIVNSSVMPAIYASNQGIASAIGTLENELAEMGQTEAFADQVALLKDKQAEVSAQVTDYVAAITQEAYYATKLLTALEARNYVENALKSIQAACADIKDAAQSATSVSSLTAAPATRQGSYRLSGVRASGQAKGLLIVDGKKTLVK